MAISRIVNSDKRAIIGVCNDKEIVLHSCDEDNNVMFLSCLLVESEIIDFILVRNCSQTGFLLCAITKDIVAVSILNAFGEVSRHITVSHNVKTSNSIKLGYVFNCQRFVVINMEETSVIFTIGNDDTKVNIHETSVQLDSTKKYAPVAQNPLDLLHIISVSSGQPYVALISQCKIESFLKCVH
jgi:hypothetical protein